MVGRNTHHPKYMCPIEYDEYLKLLARSPELAHMVRMDLKLWDLICEYTSERAMRFLARTTKDQETVDCLAYWPTTCHLVAISPIATAAQLAQAHANAPTMEVREEIESHPRFDGDANSQLRFIF